MKVITFSGKTGMKPIKAHLRPEKTVSSSLGGMPGFGAKPSWMMTERDQQQQAIEAQKALAIRAPEVWIKAGESKMLRFRDATVIACLWRYNVQTGPNQWTQFTVPNDGDTDLFRDQLGLKPSLKAVYEVIDIEGFTSKAGKTQKNVARFFNTNSRVYEQLEALRHESGPLCNYNIKISRTGSGQSTTYAVIPKMPTPMLPEWKNQPRLVKDFLKYYSPPSETEQKAVVARVGRSSYAPED
jgi:hypothetical protein